MLYFIKGAPYYFPAYASIMLWLNSEEGVEIIYRAVGEHLQFRFVNIAGLLKNAELRFHAVFVYL